jgi:hypothetical protein
LIADGKIEKEINKKELLVLKIVDNFLNETFYKNLKNIFFSDQVPWFLISGTLPNKSVDVNWLSHCVFNNNQPQSNLYNYLDEFKNKLEVSQYIQIRANLVLNSMDEFKSHWHVDYKTKNKTAIFYFNEDTSGTYFLINNKEEFVESKENRIVIFDSDIQHCGYLNKKINKRIVINFNYYNN